ncbi:MAG: NUDIX domain-containing protein [Candidatus Aenigmarchaeota archaeon]|nr:NUDIX domain-containing protein [Candidatus Aenigmarchaeota archaeon]
MKTRKISVAMECFIKKDGKYLMLHRNPKKKLMPDVWMAPGGHIERNEGLFEATRREIMEETGLKIKNLKIKVTGNAYLKDLDEELFFHFITADYDSGELKQNPEDGELIWLEPEEIVNLDNLLAELHEVLNYIFDDDSDIVSYKAVYEKGNKMTHFEIESNQ